MLDEQTIRVEIAALDQVRDGLQNERARLIATVARDALSWALGSSPMNSPSMILRDVAATKPFEIYWPSLGAASIRNALSAPEAFRIQQEDHSLCGKGEFFASKYDAGKGYRESSNSDPYYSFAAVRDRYSLLSFGLDRSYSLLPSGHSGSLLYDKLA